MLHVQLSPFRRLLPSYLSSTTPPALPGAFAASAATMTAVLSPTDALRRSILSQDDSPCVNRNLSLSLSLFKLPLIVLRSLGILRLRQNGEQSTRRSPTC